MQVFDEFPVVMALFWKRLVGWLLYCPYWPLPPCPRLGALVRLRSIGTAVFCIQRGAFDELYCGLLLNGGFLGGPQKLFRGRFCLWGKFWECQLFWGFQ